MMCVGCRKRQAITDANLCATCAASERLPAAMPAAAAFSAAALALGASVLLAKFLQNAQDGEAPKLLGGLRQARALDSFCRDLTSEARAGTLDPVIGRDEEIERVVAILARRSKNNPVLLGEPGVGKTAIVEGLAQRIASGTVPGTLVDKRIYSLSVGRLVAGTKYRGEFESRVKRLLDEINALGRNAILFIDELHALVGAGGADGALDLSAMIKPELARGELQCIGATTFDEYRRHIESDAALERRFQPVHIAEPSVDATTAILRGLRDRYARHHGVIISDEAIEAAVVLAARYIIERNFPDKAIDLIDEAASAAALAGAQSVDRDRVASVVAKWTGIPQQNLEAGAAANLLRLEADMQRRIVGQPEALRAMSNAVRRAMAGLNDPQRPTASFLLHGAAGVGKTATAKALAEALFGNDADLIRINLAEYTERHTISRLIGAPPGYAGHEDAGLLTESVRRRPYSVVLFDDVDRGHADILALISQILASGQVTDGKGRRIEFRHTILILTARMDGSSAARRLPPDLLERIDETILFRALDIDDLAQIAQLACAPMQARLAERGIGFSVTRKAALMIAEQAAEAGGAREVGRFVTRLIVTPLSERMLQSVIPPGATIRADEHDAQITLNAS